jgi:hypothetical protein
MADRPKIQLDYSSLADEGERGGQPEDARRKAVADYDESTFGERHPFAYPLLRWAVFVVVTALLACVLPAWLIRPMIFVAAVVFGLIEWGVCG